MRAGLMPGLFSCQEMGNLGFRIENIAERGAQNKD